MTDAPIEPLAGSSSDSLRFAALQLVGFGSIYRVEMRANQDQTPGGVVLDPQSLQMYAAELARALGEPIVDVYIADQRGGVLWSSVEIPPHRLREFSDASTPSVHRMNGTQCAYDYPLNCANLAPMALRITLNAGDPPGLSQVTALVEQTIGCMARQIEIDSALTTKEAIGEDTHSELSLIAEINAFEQRGSLKQTISEIAALCQERMNCESVVVALPRKKMLVTAPKDVAIGSQLTDIVARLYSSAAKKQRVFAARFTLLDGKEQHVLCAPVVDGRREVEGLVLVFGSEPKRYSKTARTISSKVVSMEQSFQKESALLDRSQLVERIEKAIEHEQEKIHSIIYFDADKVHAINDAFGYSAGDKFLTTISRIICDSAGAKDSAAHLASDRFALFMPGATTDTALAKASQILHFISQQSIDDEYKSIALSASAGIACTATLEKGGEELLIIAEVAARGAKDRGGNQCAVFQDLDNSIIQRRSDVDKVGYLQMALIENRFSLFAQRIRPMNQDAGQKFEILVRLEEGDENPAQLLSAAERYQLMSALDRWVINNALASISQTENVLEVGLSTFCINVSAQSLQDDTFVDHIESKIAETGVAPDTLCFELTETSLVRYIDRAQRFIHRLQRLGCQVALDDFGTGYSSFAYLKSLPVNLLKIDGSFVRDIVDSSLSRTIVSSVVQIAEVIGALTVAEHVENRTVLKLLEEIGVHYAQGFVVHRPEPLKNILAGLDNAASIIEEEYERIDLREYTNVRSVIPGAR